MALLLAIKKTERAGMDDLKYALDEILTKAGLTNIGRVGSFDLNAPKFPCSYGYESAGEGGFIVDYSEGRKFATESDTYVFGDATIYSIGATGSLSYRIDNTIRNTLHPFRGNVIDIPTIIIG